MIRKKMIMFVAVFAVTGVATVGAQTLAIATDDVRTGVQQTKDQTVETRKAEFQQKLTALKQARTTKLEAARLEVCQKRQQKINEIVAHGTEQNKKQLAVFQKIEANVEKFYLDKHLTSNGYAAAVANADAAEASAVAAIEVAAETTFDCTTTDSANPGSVIKEVMTAKHTALAAYRKAIKDLIVVVKKANGEQKATSTTNTEKQ